jgi:hypothetical protein
VRDLAVLFLHLLATVARLVGPGGARSMVAGRHHRRRKRELQMAWSGMKRCRCWRKGERIWLERLDADVFVIVGHSMDVRLSFARNSDSN